MSATKREFIEYTERLLAFLVDEVVPDYDSARQIQALSPADLVTTLFRQAIDEMDGQSETPDAMIAARD